MASNLKLPFRVRISFLFKGHSRLEQGLSNLSEQLFHVYAHLCTRLYKLNSESVRLLLALISANLSFFRIIYFIAHQNYSQVVTSDLSCLVYPSLAVLKRDF